MHLISRLSTFIFSVFAVSFLYGQSFYTRAGNMIKLDNGIISREILLDKDSLISQSLRLNKFPFNYIQKSCDFSVAVDHQTVNGFSGWKLVSSEPYSDPDGGYGVQIMLAPGNNARVGIRLNYVLYPGLPVMRKWISVTNLSDRDIMIEALDVEDLNSNIDNVQAVVYHSYARMKQFGRFVGNWEDPLVIVHDIRNRRGLALGNEAPGVLKRTVYHTQSNDDISIGLTHPGQNFPFRKWLHPKQEWTSPKTFIGLYAENDNGFDIVENEINKFMINYMRPQALRRETKTVFIYNTWFPFRTHVSDTLVRSIARAAADCGLQEFIIDDGWQINMNAPETTKDWGSNYGDWLIDTVKFKGGFKPVFDYLKSLKMKPGLWMSLGSATKDSKVFQDHPEWFVKDAKGHYGNIHYPSQTDDGFYSASFGTDWVDYIKEKILGLVKQYGLGYTKLDLAVVTSPYINNDSISGSYATDHPYYRDHNESFIVCYERLLQLFDELHREAPDLFIDCTFESVGKLHLMDYAFAEHADGNWMSNFEESSPQGAMRVRQLAWWRCPVLPASSLVIGNLPLNDNHFILSLKSLIGTLPIMLGDPRKLDPARRQELKRWSDWIKHMQEKYDYMSYRKDLAGFGEPVQGSWDGWQRINFNTKAGGIFGIFKNAALETRRRIFLNDLDPEKNYIIRLAPDGKIIFKGKGNELLQNGIEVELKDKYDGDIYEVSCCP